MFRGISHKWNTSWSLAKTSWFYISRDSELFWYGFFSFLFGAIIPIGIAVLVYVFIVLQSGMLTRDTDEHTVEIVFLIAAFVYYLVWAMIRYFFQAAIMTSVERRLEGRDNSFSDGIRGAMSRYKKVLAWSLMEATVFTVIKFIQNRFGENSLIGRFIASILGGTWSVLTYFSFPLMVLGSRDVKASITESGALFKKTWGERAIVYVGVNFVFTLLAFPFAFFAVIAAMYLIIQGWLVWGLTLFILTLLCIQMLAIIVDVCNSIIKVLLLYYAISGKMPEKLETVDIASVREGKGSAKGEVGI